MSQVADLRWCSGQLDCNWYNVNITKKAMMSFVLFVTNVFVLITIVLFGVPIVERVFMEVIGYRPQGWEWVLPYGVYLLIAIPLDIALFLVVFRFFVRAGLTQGDKKKLPNSAFVFLAAMAIAYAALFFLKLAPVGAKLMHASDWPAELELKNFEVCAIDLQRGYAFGRVLQPELAHGRIQFDIVNRSPDVLREATFTIKTGRDQYHRFAVRNIPSGQMGHVEREAYLGNILVLDSHPSAEVRYSAAIDWDRVRFEGSRGITLVDRPENLRVPISDCLRCSIAGTWISPEGVTFRLTQSGGDRAGTFQVTGNFSGGPFGTFPNPIYGTFDGKTFQGSFDNRVARQSFSGSFSLHLTEEGRLQGSWTSSRPDSKNGKWILTRSATSSFWW